MKQGKLNVISALLTTALVLFSSQCIGANAQDTSSLEEVLSTAIADHIHADRISVDLKGYAVATNVDYGHAEINLEECDKDKKQFTATISIPASKDVPAAINETVHGTYEQYSAVPTLKESIERGQIIEASNVTTSWVKKSQLNASVVTTSDALIGTVSKHAIKAEKPIRSQEITKETLINRNDVVSVIYNVQNLTLQSHATALESGSKGDRIRLKNLDSNKEFIGIIDSRNTVRIPTSG